MIVINVVGLIIKSMVDIFIDYLLSLIVCLKMIYLIKRIPK